MKTLSGTFAFVALAVIAIVTLPSCYRKQVSKGAGQKFYLEFRGPPDKEYLEVKQPDFDNALCALKAKGGHFKVGFKKDPEATPIDPYDPTCPTASINTDKVTTSELAKNAPAGESAANDPNAVFRVQSNSATDIQNVLDTFKE